MGVDALKTKVQQTESIPMRVPPLLARLPSLLCWLTAALLSGWPGTPCLAGGKVTLPQPLTPYHEAAQAAPEARPQEALSVHEPMFFLLGDGKQFTARFQLSFKYRLFDQRSAFVQSLPPLQGLHFGYTQTSLWNLGAESRPFEDTSYRPSLFWLHDSGRKGLLPSSLRLGYEHESNGRSELASRSIDTLFMQPRWEVVVHDRKLSFRPKLYAYLESSDNPDIYRYRGYADWILRYGAESSWIWRAKYRHGVGGHSTVQLDASYPMREPLFTRTGAFLHIQLLHGYGETLLDYKEQVGLRLWLGLSVVR